MQGAQPSRQFKLDPSGNRGETKVFDETKSSREQTWYVSHHCSDRRTEVNGRRWGVLERSKLLEVGKKGVGGTEGRRTCSPQDYKQSPLSVQGITIFANGGHSNRIKPLLVLGPKEDIREQVRQGQGSVQCHLKRFISLLWGASVTVSSSP